MIIVFGSNVYDLFFNQKDLPPHDTALFIDSHNEAPGGKGANQAVAAARAGAEVKFFGSLGRGGHGDIMYNNLKDNGIDVSGIAFSDSPSSLATIFVDDRDGTHRIVVSQGANLDAKQDTISDDELDENTTILVQGELCIKETEKLLVRAKRAGAVTIMNFAPATQIISENLLNNLDYLILNEHEALLTAKHLGLDGKDVYETSELIWSKFNCSTITTLGGEGTKAYINGKMIEVPPLKIKAIDTVGAGDAFSGYFAASIDRGDDIEIALKKASVAGSLTCTKIGAQTALPYASEVDALDNQIKVA